MRDFLIRYLIFSSGFNPQNVALTVTPLKLADTRYHEDGKGEENNRSNIIFMNFK